MSVSIFNYRFVFLVLDSIFNCGFVFLVSFRRCLNWVLWVCSIVRIIKFIGVWFCLLRGIEMIFSCYEKDVLRFGY